MKTQRQKRDPRTGKFLRQRKPSIRGIPADTDATTVDEHLRSMYSPKRFAASILAQAYEGNVAAQQMVERAVHTFPVSQYDTARLSTAELEQLLGLLRKANRDNPPPVPVVPILPEEPDQELTAIAPAPAPARPKQEELPKKKEPEPKTDPRPKSLPMPSTGTRRPSILSSMNNSGSDDYDDEFCHGATDDFMEKPN